MGAWKTVIDGDTLLVWLLIELKTYKKEDLSMMQKSSNVISFKSDFWEEENESKQIS